MPRGRSYRMASWRRRAETLERKAGELLEEIMESEGVESDITGGAHGAYMGSRELVAALLPEKDQ